MPVWPRASRALAGAALALLAGAAPVWAAPREAPARVVSINVCTDQLAMMLAAEGQLVSVSPLATDPAMSSMVDAARRYPSNASRAEEVYLDRPDLVLAGSFTSRGTVEMLRRLGIRVEIFAPARSLDEVGARMLQMGRALGREDVARARVAAFERELDAMSHDGPDRPRAALYAANGYMSGDRTLAGRILAAAGFDNVAGELGLPDGGIIPLELLAMAAPDIVITGGDLPGTSRAEAILEHPVISAFRDEGHRAAVQTADWTCGTPHVLDAVAALSRLRAGMAEE